MFLEFKRNICAFVSKDSNYEFISYEKKQQDPKLISDAGNSKPSVELPKELYNFSNVNMNRGACHEHMPNLYNDRTLGLEAAKTFTFNSDANEPFDTSNSTALSLFNFSDKSSLCSCSSLSSDSVTSSESSYEEEDYVCAMAVKSVQIFDIYNKYKQKLQSTSNSISTYKTARISSTGIEESVEMPDTTVLLSKISNCEKQEASPTKYLCSSDMIVSETHNHSAQECSVAKGPSTRNDQLFVCKLAYQAKFEGDISLQFADRVRLLHGIVDQKAISANDYVLVENISNGKCGYVPGRNLATVASFLDDLKTIRFDC
jgi:hypothetical protein